ncbi:MAG: TlpA family protein disulfide reductase [Actinobacteria bacterium]|nr:TlpA family protein disulfide reductase [Actinomycetota bacterium]MBU1494015.1 TlpA family protein disulfide reductase [Actinomycetota bacterium]MBU1866458.1 TlpA family protein disulfide reductase [Actinomycetota bacterium]
MTARQPAKPSPAAPSGRRLPLGLILGGVFTVLLIVTVFLTLGNDGSTAGDVSALPDEYGTPTVDGALPQLDDSGEDPAIGTAAPVVAGADFDGTPVSITSDGRAKVVLLVAHWCSFCRNEVPWVSEWLETTGTPDGVDFYGVATAIDRNQVNWPPSAWLDREGFSAPVLVDDRSNSIANAFGLPAYPYWVFIDAEGNIAARLSGGISAAVLDEIVASLAQA